MSEHETPDPIVLDPTEQTISALLHYLLGAVHHLHHSADHVGTLLDKLHSNSKATAPLRQEIHRLQSHATEAILRINELATLLAALRTKHYEPPLTQITVIELLERIKYLSSRARKISESKVDIYFRVSNEQINSTAIPIHVEIFDTIMRILLENALRYAMHGTAVSVGFAPRYPEAPRQLLVDIENYTEYTHARFLENGIRAKWTSPWYARSSRSSGLGLPIAVKIAAVHGFDLQFSISPGRYKEENIVRVGLSLPMETVSDDHRSDRR